MVWGGFGVVRDLGGMGRANRTRCSWSGVVLGNWVRPWMHPCISIRGSVRPSVQWLMGQSVGNAIFFLFEK